MSDRPPFNFKQIIASTGTVKKAVVPQGNGGNSPRQITTENAGLIAIEKLLKARIKGLSSELEMLKANLLEISQITHPLYEVNASGIVHPPVTPFVPPPIPTPPQSSFAGAGKRPPTTVMIEEEPGPPVIEQIFEMYPDIDAEMLSDIMTLVERAYS